MASTPLSLHIYLCPDRTVYGYKTKQKITPLHKGRGARIIGKILDQKQITKYEVLVVVRLLGREEEEAVLDFPFSALRCHA